jgi:hypothetical protein
MPVIIIGDVSFSGAKGHPAGCPGWIRRFLKRFFLVIVMDEYYTSQLCPKCWKFCKESGYRQKKCNSCKMVDTDGRTVEYHCDRDDGAVENMLSIFLCMLFYGERPRVFSRRNKKN